MQEIPAVVSITANQPICQRGLEPNPTVDNDFDTAYTEIIDDDLYNLGKS
jgi:hypothetical protein